MIDYRFDSFDSVVVKYYVAFPSNFAVTVSEHSTFSFAVYDFLRFSYAKHAHRCGHPAGRVG